LRGTRGLTGTGVSRAAGVEASTIGRLEQFPAQLDILSPQATDYDAHVMAMETAQGFFDSGILAPRQARDPSLRLRLRKCSQVPVQHGFLPYSPCVPVMRQCDLVQLNRSELPFDWIDLRLLCCHLRAPV
jgi:hypothetical protein